METNNHNYVLDIYKLIFTLVVALMHFESDYFPKEKMIFKLCVKKIMNQMGNKNEKIIRSSN